MIVRSRPVNCTLMGVFVFEQFWASLESADSTKWKVHREKVKKTAQTFNCNAFFNMLHTGPPDDLMGSVTGYTATGLQWIVIRLLLLVYNCR